jgi:hypothetical protein
VDTDRERDIAELEVHEENRKLVEEFYRARLGRRAERMMQNGEGQRPGDTNDAKGEAASGAGY